MAKFLTTKTTAGAIEEIIRSAKEKIVILSPYNYPDILFIERLKNAGAKGIEITFIYGKKKMNERIKAQLESIPNLKLHFRKDLHAKCYFNENAAIVTSLNLLDESEARNHEMGVRLDRLKDRKAYYDCVEEVQFILGEHGQVSNNKQIKVAPVKRGSARSERLPDNGYCIRCKKTIGCNPDAPLCPEDFRIWMNYENPNFTEKYCHICGKEGPASMAQPVCSACAQEHAWAIFRIDQKRKDMGVLAYRSWRKSTIFVSGEIY